MDEAMNQVSGPNIHKFANRKKYLNKFCKKVAPRISKSYKAFGKKIYTPRKKAAARVKTYIKNLKLTYSKEKSIKNVPHNAIKDGHQKTTSLDLSRYLARSRFGLSMVQLVIQLVIMYFAKEAFLTLDNIALQVEIKPNVGLPRREYYNEYEACLFEIKKSTGIVFSHKMLQSFDIVSLDEPASLTPLKPSVGIVPFCSSWFDYFLIANVFFLVGMQMSNTLSAYYEWRGTGLNNKESCANGTTDKPATSNSGFEIKRLENRNNHSNNLFKKVVPMISNIQEAFDKRVSIVTKKIKERIEPIRTKTFNSINYKEITSEKKIQNIRKYDCMELFSGNPRTDWATFRLEVSLFLLILQIAIILSAYLIFSLNAAAIQVEVSFDEGLIRREYYSMAEAYMFDINKSTGIVFSHERLEFTNMTILNVPVSFTPLKLSANLLPYNLYLFKCFLISNVVFLFGVQVSCTLKSFFVWRRSKITKLNSNVINIKL